jgi:hypothetical protein
LASSTLILVFVELLEFSKNGFFKGWNFVKEDLNLQDFLFFGNEYFKLNELLNRHVLKWPRY